MTWKEVDDHTDAWSLRIGLVLLGWFACSAYYGTLHLKQSEASLGKVEIADVPKIKALTGCEKLRADFFEAAANTSENGGDVDLTKAPHCGPVSVLKKLGKEKL